MDILPLLTAFGVGSIVTSLVQAWLAQRTKNDERRFREKQTAYIGLLEAYHQAAVERTDAAAKQFGYWQMRCALVAPKSVRDCIQQIVDTNDDQKGREAAHTAMEITMRKDLGVAE